MPSFFIYLLKVNIALLLFYVVYRFVLRRLTFYTANRWFLLFGIAFSTLFPFVNLAGVPEQLPVRQTVVFNYAPDWNAVHVAVQNQAGPMSVWGVVYAVYWMGVIAMSLFFVNGLLSLWRIYRSAQRQPGGALYFSNHDIAPFSFWNMIFVNPARHSTEELTSILQHEMVHVQERHFLDLLLADLNRIFYWFNPGAWLMKGAIRENLEFIADERVLRSGVNARAYQYQLLHTATGFPAAGSMANGFAFNQLKKRINMMNKTRSGRRQLLRYLLLLPLLASVLIIFAGYTAKRHKEKTAAALPDKKQQAQKITYACIVADAAGCKPLAGVRVEDESGNLLAITGSNGYFNVQVPNSYTNGDVGVSVKLVKPGYRSTGAGGAYHGKIAAGRQVIIGYAEMCRTEDWGRVRPQTAIQYKPGLLQPEFITYKDVRLFFSAHSPASHAADEAPQPVISVGSSQAAGHEQFAIRANIIRIQNDPLEKKLPGPVAAGKPLLIWNGSEVKQMPGDNKQFLEARLHIRTLADGIAIYGGRAKDGVYELTTFDKPAPGALVYNNLPAAWYFRITEQGPPQTRWAGAAQIVEYAEWMQLNDKEKGVIDVAGELKGRESLFIGIDNPVSITPFGMDLNDYDLNADPGGASVSITRKSKGQYNVKVSQEGKVILHVTGITSEGIKVDLGSREFEVKLIPPATVFNREKHAHLIKQ